MPPISTSDTSGWLGCRNCGNALPLQPYRPQVQDDLELSEFLGQHAGHTLTHLRLDNDAIRSSRPVWDPLARLELQVTNGEQTYVLSLQRNSVEEPPQARFRPGGLHLVDAELDIEAQLLRRAIDRAFYPQAVSPAKLDRLTTMIRETVASTDVMMIELLFDDPNDPEVSIGRLPQAVFDRITERCTQIFTGPDLERVVACLERQRCDDGVLTIRVRRRFAAQVGAH